MISVPLRTRRLQRAQLIQKMQHAAPSLVLLSDGLTRIGSGEPGFSLALGVIEVVTSVTVIGMVGRGIARLRQGTAPTAHQSHGAVDWIDIAIAAMLVVEGVMHREETGHFPRPTILLAAVMFTLGLFHGRITSFAQKRRSMHVSADGISIPGRLPFTRLTLPWAQVASVDFKDGVALIVATDGQQRRVDVSDSLDPDAVRDALLAAQAHHVTFQATQSKPDTTTT